MSELKCYLNTQEKNLCTGCRACEQICPKNAIAMKEDKEGFFYPCIDEALCVNCDLCKKVCPVADQPEKNSNASLYAAQLKNREELRRSTSGGIFIAVAKEVIDDGGVVFGCVFDDEFNVYITSAEKYEGLLAMQGSKYVQADTRDTYKKAKSYLSDGRKVLYTGTPCQIAGLKKYLGKDYDNLITIDFLCHGVPSNKLFKENVKYLEKKYKGKISDYKFRDKEKRGACMMTSFVTYKGKKIYQFGRINEYANAFTSGWIDRLCCYECKFTGVSRASDITIGDFWGIKNQRNEFEAYQGISFVMFNSDKGKEMLNILDDKMVFSKREISEAWDGNCDSLEEKREKEIPEKRSLIYKNIDNYNYLVKNVLCASDLRNLKTKQAMPKFLINILRKIRR